MGEQAPLLQLLHHAANGRRRQADGTSERLGADREPALEIGFVNEIVPRDKLLDRAFEFAARIAENGPLAVRKIKEAVIRSQGRPLEEAFPIEEECSRDVMRSADSGGAPSGDRGCVAAQHDIGVEEREQGLEVAFAGRREVAQPEGKRKSRPDRRGGWRFLRLRYGSVCRFPARVCDGP